MNFFETVKRTQVSVYKQLNVRFFHTGIILLAAVTQDTSTVALHDFYYVCRISKAKTSNRI